MIATAAGVTLLAAVVLTAAGCAPAPPPPDDGRMPVWIDTDPAIGEPERDVDDGFALVQAFNSDTIGVRGVSVVFGNTPLVRTWPIARDLVKRFGPEGMRPWRGAAGTHERHAPTEGSEALATALRAEPLTIIAIGPLTNIASTLNRDPDLRERVVRVVAVAGRRPGQRFTTGTVNPNGHRDLNFELDVEAMRIVLDSGVPLTLTPFELSSQVWLTEADIARLAEGPVAARFLAESARGWLRVWQETFSVDGFNPFDTLAVDAVASPGRFDCFEGSAAIVRGPDDATEARMQGVAAGEKDYLEVREGGDGRRVTYCHTPDAAFKERLLTTLLQTQ